MDAFNLKGNQKDKNVKPISPRQSCCCFASRRCQIVRFWALGSGTCLSSGVDVHTGQIRVSPAKQTYARALTCTCCALMHPNVVRFGMGWNVLVSLSATPNLGKHRIKWWRFLALLSEAKSPLQMWVILTTSNDLFVSWSSLCCWVFITQASCPGGLTVGIQD